MSTPTTVVVQPSSDNVISLSERNTSEQDVVQKSPLIGMTVGELTHVMKSLGEPAFRAKQVHHWMYVKNARTFDAMANVSRATQQKLTEKYQVGVLKLLDKQVSSDGTAKYLFQTPSGQTIESVLMYFDDRDTYSICMSSQVGCAVDCQFCATGKLGFKQQLSVAEIVDQYLFVQADCGKDIRNIVMMGQGEPLLNYDNVLSAIRILNKDAEVGIRHITISTSGIIPKINQLAEEGLQLVLAVSLHAPDDETRQKIMPINKKWPVADLMDSLHRYVGKTNRRVTIEYILLKGVNDTEAHAHRLGQLLKPLKCNVNLIPYNPIGEQYGFERPSDKAILSFMQTVMEYGKKVTTRVERGTDIAAACGQLANQYAQKQKAQGKGNGTKKGSGYASKPSPSS